MSQSGFQDDLASQGYRYDKDLVPGNPEQGNAVVHATFVSPHSSGTAAEGGASAGEGGTSAGEKVIILIFAIATLLPRIRDWLAELLQYSSLCHPHIVPLQAIFRTRRAVCIRMPDCNGGCMFPMVVRGGRGGIAQAAAVFLLQQAVLAVEFLHEFDKHLFPLSPQSLRISWNPQGIPILKIIAIPFPPTVSSAARSPGDELQTVATMWTPPQLVRRDAAPSAAADSKRFRIACDVWTLCVIAFFILFGRWPFRKEQIVRWARTPAGEWKSGVLFQREEDGHPAVDPVIIDTLRTTLDAGSLDAAAFADRLGDLSLLTAQQWFRSGLPAGADGMTATYRTKTEQRRSSSQFAELDAAVQQVLSAMDSGSLLTPEDSRDAP